MKKYIYLRFNTGVIKEELIGRNDAVLYQSALQYADNFLVSATGQLTFRSGFSYIQPTKNNKKAWYISFKDTLVEFTDYNFDNIYLNKITNDGPFEYGSGSCRVLASALYNILNVNVNGNEATLTLNKAFNLNKDYVIIRNNSFKNYNDIFMSVVYRLISKNTSAKQVTIDITDLSIPKAGMILKVFYNFISDESQRREHLLSEEQLPNMSFVKLEKGILFVKPNVSNGAEENNYKTLKFMEYDSKNKRFNKVSNYLSSSVKLPAPVAGICLYQGRLHCVGQNWYFASKVNDFTDFKWDTKADSAYKFKITNDNKDEQAHEFYWVSGTNRALYAGSKYGIVQISGADINTPIAPTSINVKPVGNINSAPLQAIHYLDYLIYSSRSEKSLRMIDYAPFGEGSRNIPITDFTSLFLHRKVLGMTLIRRDNNYIACVTDNGELIFGFLSNSEGNVFGSWVLCSLDSGGKFISVYTVDDDQLYVCAEIGGKSHTLRLSTYYLIDSFFKYELTNNLKQDREKYNFDAINISKKNNFLDFAINYDGYAIAKYSFKDNKAPTLTIKKDNVITTNFDLFTDGSWLTTPISLKNKNEETYIVQPIEILNAKSSKYIVLSINSPMVGTKYTPGFWARGTKTIGNYPFLNVPLTVKSDNGLFYTQEEIFEPKSHYSKRLDFSAEGIYYNSTTRCIELPQFIFKAFIGVRYIGRVVMSPFSSLDQKKNLTEVHMRLLNSHSFWIGRNFYEAELATLHSQYTKVGQQKVPFTGNFNVKLANAEWYQEGSISILHDMPHSLNILQAVVYFNE